jgi:HAD superfamily hydrolase (TIGR01509 family)
MRSRDLPAIDNQKKPLSVGVMATQFYFTPPSGSFGAVLFDCDGTLVDSMELHWDGWQHALRVNGAPYEFTRQMYQELAGVDTHKTVEILNQRHGAWVEPGPVVAAKREYFLERQQAVTPITPVADWARELHARGVPLAVVSGGAKVVVTRSLSFTGLLPLFREVITFEDVANGKPAPDMFLLAARRLEVPPADCLVVEDGEPGIIGARAAGMKVAVVTVCG